MPDIRYVCLSDMHLGEEDSLLTNTKVAKSEPDPSKPSPVLQSLINCLRHLIEENDEAARPILILNGDILELALALTNQAAMAFERFMEAITMDDGTPLFEQIIYIPGNHDHHIWEIARETQYVHYIETVKPGDKLDAPRHTTRMFFDSAEELLPAYFLTNLVQRHPHLKNTEIKVAYPNYGLRSEDGNRCVVFHHGHFIESIYQLMSSLQRLLFNREMPTEIKEIEAENFAWIDFFWSTLGRSGETGVAIESIYEHMLQLDHFKRLLSNLAKRLAELYDLPGWGDWLEATLLEKILHGLADKFSKRERTKKALPLSKDAEDGLWTYVEGPLRNQILAECNGEIPPEVSIVLGHTHKPFQQDLQFNGYPQWVDVYNTGGWVVETVLREPIHGGAVVLADENLNLTSLRMYNESIDSSGYEVTAEEASHAGQKPNPFHDRIKELLKEKEGVFREFSEITERTVYIRAQKLRSRLKRL
jgi:hypothetical protein